ncbi:MULTISPECIES: hypothetical protein [unclassified Ruegeria]|uniref:hypothetical protein n=1 Tax=unclassified Ruegeria TaxID=2625375 RepID=UPI001489E33B|nr:MULTISPECIES: hypothetical protein [unclassified Ruegeria]
MSDSVVKAGGEDVLSSIKRLVSEEVRDEPEFLFIPTAQPAKPGRLVLTEELRVGEDAGADVERDSPLQLVRQLDESREIAARKPGSEDTGPIRLRARDAVGPAPLERRNCAVDGSADPVQSETANGSGRDLAGSLSAKIEALEAAIARTEDQWEPDGESNDAYSGTRTRAVDWPAEADETVDDDGAAIFIRARKNTTDVAAPSDRKALLPEGLDETALQELIAQIVREELQGELGERVSRNLRKMVRREIARALIAEKVD